ncbi:MAG: 2-phospho-L-lactate transferase CofD family protein [Gammaproteobacteria bacterium]
MQQNVVALGGCTVMSGAHRVLASCDAADTGAFTATRESVSLLTEYVDGSCVKGTHTCAAPGRRIRRVSLTPGRARATPEAVAAVAEADTIVIGPASLYREVLPTLLVRGIAGAIAASRAPVVFVMNLMTEPGATDGYSGTDFVVALRRHVKQLPVALTVLVNSAPIPELVAARYARAGQQPVTVDTATLSNLGCIVVHADLLADDASARHDSTKLAAALDALRGSPLQ